jgi:hypothetical protein
LISGRKYDIILPQDILTVFDMQVAASYKGSLSIQNTEEGGSV